MRVTAKLSRAIANRSCDFLDRPAIRALGGQPAPKPTDERNLGGLEFLLPNLEVDELQTIKKPVLKASGKNPDDFLAAPDTPFSHSPVLSGLNIMGIYLKVQENGISGADNWWSIMPWHTCTMP